MEHGDVVLSETNSLLSVTPAQQFAKKFSAVVGNDRWRRGERYGSFCDLYFLFLVSSVETKR